jgi:hypothetical protein
LFRRCSWNGCGFDNTKKKGGLAVAEMVFFREFQKAKKRAAPALRRGRR